MDRCVRGRCRRRGGDDNGGGIGQAPAATATGVRRAGEDDRGASGRARLRRRDVRSLVLGYLGRIRAYDLQGPQLNAMLAMNPKVLEIADAMDRERAARGPRGPLHGIPIVVKDNFETVDMPTTGGSLALTGFMTGRDAFQVKRLRDAGAVIIGKTNLHELAAGITTISSAGGQTRNPYDPSRTPGGSSGGTGAAVAASFAAAGMGSDTCGSIRIPSANNNLFGLRGTAGLSSRDGIIPLSHTQDIGGPLARTVADLAIMLDATVGADPADAVTQGSAGHIPASYRDLLNADGLRGARIGVVKELFGSSPEDDEVAAIDRKALDAMKKAGAELVEISLPEIGEQMRGTALIDAEFKFDLSPIWPDGRMRPSTHWARFWSAASIRTRSTRCSGAATREPRRTHPTWRKRRADVLSCWRRSFACWTHNAWTRSRIRHCVARPRIIGEPQRGAANCQLSREHGTARDRHARRVHRRWRARGHRVTGTGLERGEAARDGVRLRTGDASAPSAAVDTCAGEQQGAIGADLHRQPRGRARDVLVRSGGRIARVGRHVHQTARRLRAPRASGARACHADDQQGERGGGNRQAGRSRPRRAPRQRAVLVGPDDGVAAPGRARASARRVR